jgi:hypothetical protein
MLRLQSGFGAPRPYIVDLHSAPGNSGE